LENFFEELLRKGAIKRLDYKPRIVLPLSVIKRVGKDPRLVVDCSRQVNPCINVRPVKLPTLQKMNEGAEKGSYWSSLDLEAGYFHLRLAEEVRDNFGFRAVINGKVEYCHWVSAFLGINDMVREFDKLMRPIVEYLQSLGIHVDFYIDEAKIIETCWKERDSWNRSRRHRSQYSREPS
jgi:hypothetical protein